jgi:lipoprotein-releasing system ATP-binding protein
MNKSVLSLHSVSKSFKQGSSLLLIIKNVTAEFMQGSSYAITGASGSGKSTLLHILAGLEAPTSGIVNFNSSNLAHLQGKPREHFFNNDLGFIFQLPFLINELTVLENVMMKGIIKGMKNDECKKKAYILLEQLGIQDKALSFPQLLSGGQQQRVAIARALLNQPAFLLADEPTGNLDEENGHILLDLLISYQKEYGMGLIISSHDAYVVQKMDVTTSLHDGFLFHTIKGLEHDKRIGIHS